jgi:hypothetical protein
MSLSLARALSRTGSAILPFPGSAMVEVVPFYHLGDSLSHFSLARARSLSRTGSAILPFRYGRSPPAAQQMVLVSILC